MKRVVTFLVSVTALIAVAVAPVTAQAPPAPGPAPGAPAPPAVQQPPTPREIEGTVKKVDPGQRTVQISSGILGIFGTTVEVTGDTEIRVEGRKGSLADIREGEKVKASYEARQGKNVAKSLEVMPAEQKPAARPAPPAGAPGSPARPPAGQPQTQ